MTDDGKIERDPETEMRIGPPPFPKTPKTIRLEIQLSTREMVIYTILSILGGIVGLIVGAAIDPREPAGPAAVCGVIGALAWPLAVKHFLFTSK